MVPFSDPLFSEITPAQFPPSTNDINECGYYKSRFTHLLLSYYLVAILLFVIKYQNPVRGIAKAIRLLQKLGEGTCRA